jgi:hypothetical protein
MELRAADCRVLEAGHGGLSPVSGRCRHQGPQGQHQHIPDRGAHPHQGCHRLKTQVCVSTVYCT